MNEAPVLVQTYDLNRWMLQHVAEERRYPTLTRALLSDVDAVLCLVTSALHEREPLRFVAEADRRLAHLTIHVRLVRSFDLMSEEQYEFVCRQVREIGRQIGGWRKRLE